MTNYENMHNDVISFREFLKNNNKRGIVLDIDETLSLTAYSWFQILDEMYPNDENLSIDDLCKKYHMPQNVPCWLNNSLAMDWISNARLDPNAHMRALPINSSINIVKNLESVPILGYVSARYIELKPTTEKWLENHGFPKLPIIHKDDKSDIVGGNRWKARVLTYLYPYVEGIVDDNPQLIDFLEEFEYKGTLYLYNIKENKKTDVDVVHCPNWDKVSFELIKIYSSK